MLEVLKRKYLKACEKKYPDAVYIYNLYKSKNKKFHQQNKQKSWKYFWKLIQCNKKHGDLFSISVPNGAKAYGENMTIGMDSNVYSNNTCLAIPDSQLLQRKDPIELANEMMEFDIISFDVFDTCIFRPFEKPTDLFYLLESQNGMLNFTEFRMKAEQFAREKTDKANGEVDIYDIYKELSNICPLTVEDAKKEIELEKEVCYANPYILELFNALKEKGKTIIAISDMYLPSAIISQILEKNGFVGFEKIYVSNEHGFNKNSGMLFNIVQRDYGINRNYAHIGDSREADIEGAQKAGITTFLYQQCNEFGNKYRPRSMNPVVSVYNGIVNNYMYCGAHKNSAREDFGFIYAGPIVVGYLEWINRFVKNNGLDKILFFARDMDIFYKTYNEYFKEYENEYVHTSRFALQQFLIGDFPDEVLWNIIDVRNERGYTIERSFKELNFEFLLPELERYKLNKNSFISNANIKTIYKLIKDNLEKVVAHYKDNEEAAKKYFKEKIGNAKKICMVDLGWRGSIHYYLKYLLVDKWKLCEEVKGVLFGSSLSNAAAALVARGIVTVYAFDTLHNREYLRSPLTIEQHTFVCSVESIFTSEESSLIEYRLNKKTNEVEFVTFEENPNKKIVREIHTGIKRFVKVFEGFREKYRDVYPIAAVDAFDPLNNIFKNWDYISMIIGDVLDTPYQVAGFNLEKTKYVPIGELMRTANLIKKWPLI